MFIGLQRNHIPTIIVLLNRFTMSGLVALVAFKHWGLAEMGFGVALANGVSYFASYMAWRRWVPQIEISPSHVTRDRAREIGSYCGSTSVWLLAMLMVSGLDLTIVGMFDYSATAYYAVAATLTNFVAQAQGAIFAAMLPASAVLAARGDEKGLGAMLVSSTRYGMLILLAMALPLMLAGNWALGVWVGTYYASRSTLILQVLLVANVVRLCALPYATLLLGTGQQRKVILSPLAEGMTNLAASIVGAYVFGAMGVAAGTLIGAFVSIGFHLLYNMPRTSCIAIDRLSLVRQGLLRPLVCAVPVGLVLLFRAAIRLPSSGTVSLFLLAGGLLGTMVLFWQYGLLGNERARLEQALRIS
jgi:O-antigen/teichoic acid export membrane protein